MSRVGKWKRQILLCLLGLGGLVIIAGSSAAAPVGTYPEQQQVTSELDEAADLKPASTAVVQAASPVDPDVKRQLIAEVYEAADLQPSSTAVVQAEAPVDPDRERSSPLLRCTRQQICYLHRAPDRRISHRSIPTPRSSSSLRCTRLLICHLHRARSYRPRRYRPFSKRRCLRPLVRTNRSRKPGSISSPNLRQRVPAGARNRANTRGRTGTAP